MLWPSESLVPSDVFITSPKKVSTWFAKDSNRIALSVVSGLVRILTGLSLMLTLWNKNGTSTRAKLRPHRVDILAPRQGDKSLPKLHEKLTQKQRLKSEVKYKVASLSHNIARSKESLVTLPCELWHSILSSVTHPGIDPFSTLVENIFASYNVQNRNKRWFVVTFFYILVDKIKLSCCTTRSIVGREFGDWSQHASISSLIAMGNEPGITSRLPSRTIAAMSHEFITSMYGVCCVIITHNRMPKL